MDRYIIREARAGAECLQGNQIIAFQPSTAGNNMIPEQFYPSYGAEYQNVRESRYSLPQKSYAPANMMPGQIQMMSGIDPNYLAAYSNLNTQYTAGHQQMHREPMERQMHREPMETQMHREPMERQMHKEPMERQMHREPMETQMHREPMERQMHKEPMERQMHREPMERQMHKEPMERQMHREPMETQMHRDPMERQMHKEPMERQMHKEPMERQMHREPMERQMHKEPMERQIHREPMERQMQFRPDPVFGSDYQNRSLTLVDRNKIYAPAPSETSRHFESKAPRVNSHSDIKPRPQTPKPPPQTASRVTNAVPVPLKKTNETETPKNELQSQVLTRSDKLKALHRSGPRAFSGPVEKVLKWHKALQDVGVLIIFEIVAKCVSIQPGKSCSKNLVVRDDNGPAMQVVYYEIDFLLPELKPPCTVRVVGRMMPGACRLHAFSVRAAGGDDVAALPRRAAVASHHVAKLCREYGVQPDNI